METDSPVTITRNQKMISKKLFHSPIEGSSPKSHTLSSGSERKRHLKRKLNRRSLIPDDEVNIKIAYVAEYDSKDQSPEPMLPLRRVRKKVLVSLFHNKEYSIDSWE